MAKSEGSNLLLIYQAAQILEQNGTNNNNSSGHNGLNSQTGSIIKKSKRMKPQIAAAPTTVEVTDLDAFEVDIIKEDNPFAKEDDEDDDDEEEEEESDDSSNHGPPCFKFPKLKFTQSAKPVSHAKLIHNAKEKNRRKTLKQAQLSLHKVLHPHSHQKPVLRIILCNAIYEIKRLKTAYEENESCLAALRERRSSLTEQLESLKSIDLVQDDGTDSKDSDISRPHSVDDESFLDVEEEGEDDSLDKDINNNEVTSNDPLTSINTITNPADTPPSISQSATVSYPHQLYYYTQMLGCTNQLLQSMQLHTYMNSGNLWLPPLLWPNLHTALHSNMTAVGISGNSSPPVNPALQALNEAAGVQQSAAQLVCSPPVKCSVLKSIGGINSNSPHHEPLNQSSTSLFCRQLC